VNTYDDLGNLLSTKDPGQHTTTFGYSDRWANAACVGAANTRAYLTLTTDPLSHRTQRSYYPCTGLPASNQNENDLQAGRAGTTFAYDLMNRRLTANYPDGGQISDTYGDAIPASITQTSLIDNTSGLNLVHTKVLDDLGRVKQVQLQDPDCAGPVNVDYTYGYDPAAHNRFTTVSNPYCGITDPTYGITTTRYDALDRLFRAVPTDGSDTANNISTVYAGNVATATDQVGNKRQTVSDSLGRLITAWEPNSSGAFVNETDYVYDTLDNLTSVTQKGNAASSSWRTRSFAYDSLSRLTSATNPESGTTTYTYDADGNVLTKVAPKPNQTSSATVTATYGYDADHRLTQKSYSDTTPLVKYGYDGISPAGCTAGLTPTNPVGLRTVMCDGSGTSSWSYDPMGRAVTLQRTVNGFTRSATYQYNQDGSLNNLAGFDAGQFLYYGYNAAARPVSLRDRSNNYVSSAHYSSDGQITSALYDFCPNGLSWCGGGFAGLSITNSYNKRLQPVILSGASPSQTVFSLSYDFHLGTANNGNVYQIVNNRDNNRTQTFTFDQLNRVASASSQGPLWGNSYVYDAWGNLLQKNVTKGTSETLNVAVSAKNQIVGATYDAAGNMINDGGGHAFTYDAENRLLTAGGYTYTYDGDGERVKKTNGATGKLYWYDPQGNAPLETDLANNTANWYMFFNGRLASLGNTGLAYYFSDHLGSSSVITNGTGTIQDESDYYPFGGERVITSATGQRYKFTGKERDTESGLDMFGARYYASSLGRFMQTDPKAKSAHMLNPQSWNRYAYTLNNPLKYVDPDGMDVVLAANLSAKDRAYIVNNLARMYATPAGKAMLQRADASKFTITVGTGHLGRTDLTNAPPGTVVFGGQTKVEGGTTTYGVAQADGHKMLVAQSPDSPTAPPIQVTIDKSQAAEIGKDPATVFAHELGGHTADVLNAAESNPNQFIDSVNPKDESSSEAAEKALGKLPNQPSQQDVQAVEQIVKPLCTTDDKGKKVCSQ